MLHLDEPDSVYCMNLIQAQRVKNIEAALQKQMEMQKLLHKQLDMQRELQMSLDQHGKYLKEMIGGSHTACWRIVLLGGNFHHCPACMQ